MSAASANGSAGARGRRITIRDATVKTASVETKAIIESQITPAVVVRFGRYVDRAEECWAWTGALRGDGYGAFHLDGSQYGAHRVAWVMAYGPIPDGLVVCHHCDTPRCVNPTHLFLGTDDDNLRDMVAKGRQALGERNARYTHPETTPRGERHGRARLTGDGVRDARAKHASGVTCAALSRAYGVSYRTMRLALRRETWASLPPLFIAV